MSAGEVAILAAAVAGVVGVILLSVALVAVTRALRSLEQAVALLRQDELQRRGAPAATAEPLASSAGRRRDAGSLLARVAVANPYLDVSDPVIKVLALASGTTRAATRLRRGRQEG